MSLKSILTAVGLMIFPFSFALPIPLIYKSAALVVFCLTVFIYFSGSKKETRKPPKYGLHLWYVIFFFVGPLTTLFREGQITVDSTRLAFLVLPLVMPFAPELLRRFSDRMLQAFLLGVLIYIGYALVFVVYFYGWGYPDKEVSLDYYLKYVLYNYLPGAIHHTYMGLFLTFAMVIALQMERLGNGYRTSLIILLFLAIPFLGSKWSLLAGLIVLILWAFRSSYKNSRLWSAALIFVICAGLIWAGTTTDLFRTIHRSLEQRLQLFQCAFLGIQDHWLLGLGKDAIKPWMESCTVDKLSMDAHNIFLQELLSTGIWGP